MKRLTLDAPVPERFRGGIIALGNFDGFHLGHQAVVGRAVARAHHEGRPALVATFDPHPASYFHPGAAPFRLTSLNQRQRLFLGAGADAMLVLGFNAVLAATSAEEFVSRLLIDVAGAAGVITGDDFTFGRGRRGTAALLADYGAAHGLAAESVAAVGFGGEPVSSSTIRAALAAGDPGSATRLLSRPFAIEGVVEHGDARGRQLGYPTANIGLSDYQRPAYGIYAVRVRLDDGNEYAGVANIGIRPTFEPPVELVEAHLFDFDGDLYGRTIEVALHRFLRPEARFDDVASLVQQMDRDSAEARRLLQA